MEGRTLDQAPESLEVCRGLVAEAASGGAEVVVLPEGCYPAYVLGSAEAGREALAAGPVPEEAFGVLAAEHGVTLVAGLVLDSPRGLLNAAVTFGPDGAVLARTAKRFLWHFDHSWFVAGEESAVVDVPFGRVGALVCADARQPAIARGMMGEGAGLICDPTAWVTSTPGAPHNIQPDFLIQARCIENGIVMACASKAGFEGPTVAYAGRSMIVGPEGDVLAEAPERGDMLVSADVSLDGLPRPAVAPKPEWAEWAEGLATDWKPQAPSALSLRVAAANHVPDADVIQRLVVEGVALLVHPDGVEQLADTPVRGHAALARRPAGPRARPHRRPSGHRVADRAGGEDRDPSPHPPRPCG